MFLCKCKYCPHEFVGGPLRIRAHILNLVGNGVDKCEFAPENVRDVCRRLQSGAAPMQGTDVSDAQVCPLGLGDTQGVSNVGSMTNACASSSGGNDVASSSKKQRVSKGNLSQGKLAEAWQMQAR
ncbi:hypothetical protein L7F22_047255 [Adiantum nelumboides]|nr:hypothetical protein [Adiantum nelumboides]